MTRIVQVTDAELRVARAMLHDGASNRVIGQRLFIAEDTVKVHVRGLLRKAGASDRLALAVLVLSGRADLSSPTCGSVRDELTRLQAAESRSEIDS